MRNVIVLVFDATDRERIETARWDGVVTQVRAEVAALRIQYARASAERHGRFEQRLESTRRELLDASTRLRTDIDGLEQERDGTLRALHEQLENACAEVRRAVEQRLAQVEADYETRIANLTRACELADAAIAG